MRAIRGALVSRWTLSFVGAALLALLVWFLGALVLESGIVRAAIASTILLLWLVANLLLGARRRRADRILAEGVAAPSAGAVARADEAANLRDRLATAMSLLRKASGSRGYLYEQPWYVIIGPPGAGKTTALLNAGLKFPLAAEMGQGAVAGVGGTRLCDWWFTERAVLIDTAGRYTTQDSDAAVDRAGWEGFLDLLRRTRPRQPLNGVLVAIGIPDVAQAAAPERMAHARAIRRRIKELTERLGLRLPIYALFTKADLLAGFSEYFDDLDRAGRDQVWGHSFALAEGATPAGPIAGWTGALHGLVGRLNGRLVDRLQAERSAERRALLAGFPAQLASLEVPLGEFLAEAFGGSRLDPAPQLRGVYLTSGTQAGTPIDRLTGVLAQGFGVDQMRVPSLRPQQGRSYFLGGLLRLVFNEAMLGSARPGAVRRRRLWRLGGFAAVGLVMLGLAGGLLASWLAQRREAVRVDMALAQYERLVTSLGTGPVADPDLGPVAPVLDQAAALAHIEDGQEPIFGLGLSQAGKYGAETRLLYDRALQRILLPRLVLGLERQMRTMLADPASSRSLYQAMDAYLMLCGRLRMNADLVREVETLAWQSAYPGASADLLGHLDALLASAPRPTIEPDAALVADVTRVFPVSEVAKQIYASIAASKQAKDLPSWTAALSLGAADTQLLYRASGRPLSEGVEGFFSPDGFYGVFLPQLAETARQAAAESWLPDLTRKGGDAMLRNEVSKLYTDAYARAWDTMLGDLRLRPIGRGSEAVRTLYLLAPPGTRLQDLLISIVKRLDLGHPPVAEAGRVLNKLEAKAGGDHLALLLGDAGAAAEQPGNAIDAYYAPLRGWVGPAQGAELGVALKMLSDLREQLSASPGAGAPGATPAFESSGDAAQLLRNEASHAPMPVSGWLQVIASGSSATEAENVKAGAQAAFAGVGGAGALCAEKVAGSYPFVRGAAKEISLGDFTRLFAPGGVFDSFFKARVAPFVIDPEASVWRLQAVNGVAPPVTGNDLAQFQRAAKIGAMFFGDGAASPSVHFSIVPDYLDAGSRQASLDLGGISVAFAHQPAPATHVTWPSPLGMESARLSFDTAQPAGVGAIETEGQWALFRLIDRGTLYRSAVAGQAVLGFKAGGHSVEYKLRVDATPNPFTSGLLQEFRCPLLK